MLLVPAAVAKFQLKTLNVIEGNTAKKQVGKQQTIKI
jgi:hypothetical protein